MTNKTIKNHIHWTENNTLAYVMNMSGRGAPYLGIIRCVNNLFIATSALYQNHKEVLQADSLEMALDALIRDSLSLRHYKWLEEDVAA